MRIHSLTLLSFLLLAIQVLLVMGQKEFRELQSNIAPEDQWIPLGKPQIVQKSQQEKYVVSGIIATRDRAKCYLTVTDHKESTNLMLECTRFDHKFSCVFAGNPKSCISCFGSDIIYWRQIAQNLHWQNSICENSKMVLRTRVCGWRFPESNLKLVYSSLIHDPHYANRELNPWCRIFVKGASDKSSKNVKHHYPMQQSQTIAPLPTKGIQLPETTPTVPTVNEETTSEHLVVEETTTTQQTTTTETTPEQTTPTQRLVMRGVVTTQPTTTTETTPEQTTPTRKLVMEETTTTQTTTTTETTPEQTTPTESFYTKEDTTTIPVEIQTTMTTKPNRKDDSSIKIKQKTIQDIYQNVDQKTVQQTDLDTFQQTDLDTFQLPDLGTFQQTDLGTFQQADLDTFQQADLDTFQQADLDTFQQADLDTFQQMDLDTFQQMDLDTFQQMDLDTFQQMDLDTFQQTY